MWLQRELSQWHAAAHAKQELQKSQEQLQALEEQVGSKPSLGALGGAQPGTPGTPLPATKPMQQGAGILRGRAQEAAVAQHCGLFSCGTFLQLRAQKEQNQTLQRSLVQQQEVLAATKAREMQNLQQLSRHRQTIHDLQQKAASSRKHIAELLQQVTAETGQPHDAASCHAAPPA